jgi:tight adherence protein C
VILLASAMWLLALTALTLGWRARERSPAPEGPSIPALVRILRVAPVPGAVTRALGWVPRMTGGAAISSDMERARVAGALGAALIAGITTAGRGIVSIVAAAVIGALALVAFDAWMASTARQRRHEILRELPDVLDMISVAMAAGVGTGAALRLASQSSVGPIALELARAEDELRLGVSRRQALADLSARVGLPELRRAVGAVRDGEELGAPLSHVLADQARSIRIAQREEVRMRAATAAPKIQLVVALTMVPAAMMLVLGVLVLNLASQVGAALG